MKLHYITISAILLSVTSCADFDKINIDPENSIYVGAGDTGNDSNDDERSTSIDFPETIPDDELAFAKENEASQILKHSRMKGCTTIIKKRQT